MSAITLEQARTIIRGAWDEGRRLGFAPLSIVVLDAGGARQGVRTRGWGVEPLIRDRPR